MEQKKFIKHRLDFPNNHKLFLPHDFKDHKWFYSTIGISEKDWFYWNRLIKEPQDTKKYNTALKVAYRNIARGYWQMTRLTGKNTAEYQVATMKCHDHWRVLNHLSFEDPKDLPCDRFLDMDWNTRTPIVL